MKKIKLWQIIMIVIPVVSFIIAGCASDSSGSGSNAGNNSSNESAGVRLRSNKTGRHQGYNYEFWADSRGAGSGTMTLTGDGSFLCEWRNTYNILFRMGKRYNETQTHKQIGTFALEYGFSDYEPVGTSYVTVYGWTVNPLVEFYIVENWGPNDYKGGGGYIKDVTIGGDVYEIHKTVRNNQPSIKGNRTFDQYWSIRKTRRSEGIIPVSEHFAAWEEAGLNMNGRMYEVAFCIEAFGGQAKNASGAANVYKNKLTVNGVEVNAN
jgi:endo-1,4-beta-xylanase